jgi:glycosyltransferase involved in cell wall biosynthesis
MPLSILEAMAASLPIASTDVGDVREMLSPENDSCVVPCEDRTLADALADALTALLGDSALRTRIGAANRSCAERSFSQADMFAAYAQLFDGEC